MNIAHQLPVRGPALTFNIGPLSENHALRAFRKQDDQLRNRTRGPRQQSKRMRHKPIACQDRQCLAKHLVVGRIPAAKVIVVHRGQIIVNQRKCVDALQRQSRMSRIVERFRRRPGKPPASGWASVVFRQAVQNTLRPRLAECAGSVADSSSAKCSDSACSNSPRAAASHPEKPATGAASVAPLVLRAVLGRTGRLLVTAVRHSEQHKYGSRKRKGLQDFLRVSPGQDSYRAAVLRSCGAGTNGAVAKLPQREDQLDLAEGHPQTVGDRRRDCAGVGQLVYALDIGLSAASPSFRRRRRRRLRSVRDRRLGFSRFPDCAALQTLDPLISGPHSLLEPIELAADLRVDPSRQLVKLSEQVLQLTLELPLLAQLGTFRARHSAADRTALLQPPQQAHRKSIPGKDPRGQRTARYPALCWPASD